MAIEITSKTDKGKEAPIFRILLLVGIVFLFFSVGSYFYLQYLNIKSEKSLQEITDKISQKRTPEIKDLEKEISLWDQKIKDYNLIFGNHGAPSNIFVFLEKTTLQKIWWSNFDLETPVPKAAITVKLKGVADNFSSLQQQILIFEKEEFVKKITLNQAALSKSGQVDFDLEISFYPGILNPQVENKQ